MSVLTFPQLKSYPKWPFRSRPTFLVVLLILTLIMVIMAVSAGAIFWRTQQTIDKVVVTTTPVSAIATVIDQIQETPVLLKGQIEGRTNLLLIGQDYGQLTDTMLVASYFWSSNKLVFINMPRDFKITTGGNTTSKLNSYMFSPRNPETVKEEGLTKFIGSELDIPIHYWASIDIEGVSKVVDAVGGIEVDVESAFTDCQYPAPGYAGYIFPCPDFQAGKQLMTGERAVIYARSRHSFNNPGEAIDFARSKRQTLIIQATIDKIRQDVKSDKFAENLPVFNRLLDVLENHSRISINPRELFALHRHIQTQPTPLQTNRYVNSYGTILCDEKTGTDIPYCDGNIGGTERKSTSREQLRKIVRELENVTT